MKMYKGFNKDMTCNGFQYAEGKTYETEKAVLCKEGFHACERPLDVLNYYMPATSVYHEVELGDVMEQTDADSKRVGKKITIGKRLDINALCEAQAEYVKANTTNDSTAPKSATAGDRGAATAGYRGAATAGYSGAATAGYSGAATSKGSSAVGINGVACARSVSAKVKGGLGALLVIAVEDSAYNIKDWKAVIVDGEKVKADTWYALEDGELIEA